MDQEWYYARHKKQAGPVDWAQLQQLAAAGQLSAADLVWADGMADWVAAETITGLMPPAAPTIATGEPLAPGIVVSDSPAVVTALSYFTPVGRLPLAGFWLRLLAWIADTIILTILWFGLSVLCMIVAGNRQSRMDAAMWVSMLLSFILYWLYFALQESGVAQGTFGKQMAGLKVTDLEGNRISFAKATGRYFAKFLSGGIFCIGFLMVAFTAKKQALHDMLMGCLVIRKT